MKLRVFDTIAIPSPPKEKLSESQKNFAPPPPHTRKKWHGPRVRGEKRLPT